VPRRSAAVLVSLALAAPLLLLSGPASAAPAAPTTAKPYDVNGDGFPEQVVGAPDLQVGSVKGAGGVFVLPASKKGLSTAGRTITQATTGVAGAAGGRFGAAFASADFDHDGYADLAVGAPANGAGSGDDDAGSVTVLFGSSAGLTRARSIVLHRAGTASGDDFGSSLATADLNGDGWSDLAVGAPSADRLELPEEDFPAAGSVTVLRGGPDGFSTSRSSVLHGKRSGRTYDYLFGSSLAVGNVDGNSAPDLVVAARGSTFEDGDGYDGFVTVCPSGASCTRLSTPQTFPGLDALAVGNVSGSSRPEIVVGVADADQDASRAGPCGR